VSVRPPYFSFLSIVFFKASVSTILIGLYRELDDEFRIRYNKLWKGIINADEVEIKRQCDFLKAGQMYTLLTAMLTMRPWDDVVSKVCVLHFLILNMKIDLTFFFYASLYRTSRGLSKRERKATARCFAHTRQNISSTLRIFLGKFLRIFSLY
jgi:hypothetical protein